MVVRKRQMKILFKLKGPEEQCFQARSSLKRLSTFKGRNLINNNHLQPDCTFKTHKLCQNTKWNNSRCIRCWTCSFLINNNVLYIMFSGFWLRFCGSCSILTHPCWRKHSFHLAWRIPPCACFLSGPPHAFSFFFFFFFFFSKYSLFHTKHKFLKYFTFPLLCYLSSFGYHSPINIFFTIFFPLFAFVP